MLACGPAAVRFIDLSITESQTKPKTKKKNERKKIMKNIKERTKHAWNETGVRILWSNKNKMPHLFVSIRILIACASQSFSHSPMILPPCDPSKSHDRDGKFVFLSHSRSLSMCLFIYIYICSLFCNTEANRASMERKILMPNGFRNQQSWKCCFLFISTNRFSMASESIIIKMFIRLFLHNRWHWCHWSVSKKLRSCSDLLLSKIAMNRFVYRTNSGDHSTFSVHIQEWISALCCNFESECRECLAFFWQSAAHHNQSVGKFSEPAILFGFVMCALLAPTNIRQYGQWSCPHNSHRTGCAWVGYSFYLETVCEWFVTNQ